MWSDVDVLTSDDTGTARFDSVSRQETGSGLYQVDTLVKISTANKEKVTDPHLSSSNGSNWSIVVADKTVILFDESFQTLLLLLHFESDVDAVSVCRGRKFLVVCERNGNLHLVYVPYKKILLTRALVEKTSAGDKKTYHSLIIDEDETSSGMYHMFLLLKDGFFHMTNLALEKIEIAIEKMDMGALKELQSLIRINFSSCKDDGYSTAVMVNLGHDRHLMIGGRKENIVSNWKMGPCESKMCFADSIGSGLIPGVRKMVAAENQLYILDTEDVLSLWDLHFLLMIHCWPDLLIHDFELTVECGSTSSQDKSSMKMISLMKQDNNQICSLQIRSLPTMEVCYSLDICSVSCLVQSKINMDTIYLVEGVSENSKSSQAEPITSVVVRCFTEALPENRLSRLLHKHMFEEAEKFAITFELDLELVYKVKLDFILEQLASASVGGYGHDVWAELVDEAKTNLMKITDAQYVVDYCLKAPWPTFEMAMKMLNHASSRYSCMQTQEAMARLATFYSLHGSENFNAIAWIEFLNNSDSFGEVLTHLRDGDMRGAQLLWLRNEGQIAAEFDENKLETLLSAIPLDLSSRDLGPWFRKVLVPFVRRVLPRGQRVLAKWLWQKARDLELTEKDSWPQNGLDLAVLGVPSLWTWLISDDSSSREEVENLKSLVSHLHQLLDLHQKYNCKLSLSVFEKGNISSVAFFMLDKVLAPQLIAATVENAIVPYTQEHNIPFDELLLQYIKDLLQRCSSRTTTLFTEWEAKAVAVLNCMTDADLKVDAVLEIMQKAVVPWSSVVEKLVQQYLEMDGPKQELLKESYCLMEIRKLLRGYGISNFNLSTSTQVMRLIRYILKQDLPMSLEDSLTLAEAYKLPISQINYLYLIQLSSHGKIEEILCVLKKLSSAEAECVIERLTAWARLQLEDKDHISEEHKKHQMVITQVMVEALKYLQIIKRDDPLKSLECENNLDMFKAIAHLQEDFDVFFTPFNYEDPIIRKQIQERHITAYENTRYRHSSAKKSVTTPVVANDPDGKTKTISTEAGLRRLGRQLQRTEQELWSDLALRALGAGKVDKALKILSELYEHHYNSSTGRVLFTAAKMLCQMLEADVPMVLPEGMDLPAVIHDLACQAITVCDSDLLLDCLELCKCTRIAMDVYHQCQLSDNFDFMAKDFNLTGKDSFSQWIFQDVFNEDCIVLDPMSVLPVQYEITNCLLPVAPETKLYPLDCSCLSHCSFDNGSNYLPPLLGPITNMLQMLQECTQLELTLRVLVNSYGSCLQHVTSNIMDLKLSVQLYDAQELKKYNKCLSDLRNKTTLCLNAVAVALLNKVFNWRVVDCDLAIGLCTLLPKAEVLKILWKVIDNTWQNYDKILAVAKVGANLCSLYNEPEEQRKFLSVITDAEWGIKLGKLEISIQPVFRKQPEMKSSLIPDLVKNSRITPDIILQYCSAFCLDRDRVIIQYISTFLLVQEGEEEEECDLGSGKEALQPLGNADVLERVLQIIPLLHSTSELTETLCASMFKLSPYNYERIEVVLTVIRAADENVTDFSVSQALALLQHLKSYKRVCPPSDVESLFLFENGLMSNSLSKIRLPFHLLIQTKHYWKIITPELSEETFPTLLLISKLMKVSLDKLYMSAANHVFEKKIKPLLLEQRKKAQNHSYNRETFKKAKTMMKFIHCIQNPELAAATAHSITQELPPGHEKTQSLRFCLALGEAWLKDSKLEEAARNRGETFLSKLRLQFQRSATENTLISNRLSSPEHLKLTGLPTRLIAALYEHCSVEQRFREPGGQTYSDIHAAVKEIATINNVDLVKIRNIMLEKWICKTGLAVTKEASNNPDCVSNVEEDPDLMRVVYMLQSCPMEDAVLLLNSILSAETWPLSTSGPRLTFCHRTRVLLCLVRLADGATLEAQLQIPRTKIPYYLKCYIFVTQLEALNIPYTVQSFVNSPKEGLVKGLWKNHSHEPQAVRLIADLCLEYQVYDPQLWNSLLQRLHGFNLISHLQKVLDAIMAVPALWEMSSLSMSWRTITVGSSSKVCLPLDSCELENLYRSFVLLTKCPFLLSLDLRAIASDFEKVDLHAFALGALCLIPCVKTREREIKAFLSATNLVTVLSQVDELMDTGELAGIPSKVREAVLNFICLQGLHSTVLNSKHSDLLRDFVLSSGKPEAVKEFVDSLISENRQDEADKVERKFRSLQHVKKENAYTEKLKG
ncbi:kinetochore-associated protein 1 [Gouania willdenowi]|uniref:kinetochore-associated protein 1 n=1 Tax=Gouania willdenowi TaxID=441366 RepID=UPI001054E69F|nr:kinetochore-associated protein 1 [Gouania willdenowi]